MTYTYPRIQNPYKNTVFLMQETFDMNKYSLYQIPYQGKNGVVIRSITHELLQKLIEKDIIKVEERDRSFNDKKFIRLPLEIQLELF